MASASGSMSLRPTLAGCVCFTTTDALLVIELALQGRLDFIRRRPHDRERTELVRSGNIFIFNAVESGIKRWTDGIAWSPSRIMGNYLIYRELAQPFPAGEKKKAQKRVSKSRRTEPNLRESNELLQRKLSESGLAGDSDRNLVGSLVDSYGFKHNGLVKKTMSVKLEDNREYHLISYYRPDDVVAETLQRPALMPLFQNINIRPVLLDTSFQGFRTQQEPQPPSNYGGSAYDRAPSLSAPTTGTRSTLGAEHPPSPLFNDYAQQQQQQQYAPARLDGRYPDDEPAHAHDMEYTRIKNEQHQAHQHPSQYPSHEMPPMQEEERYGPSPQQYPHSSGPYSSEGMSLHQRYQHEDNQPPISTDEFEQYGSQHYYPSQDTNQPRYRPSYEEINSPTARQNETHSVHSGGPPHHHQHHHPGNWSHSPPPGTVHSYHSDRSNSYTGDHQYAQVSPGGHGNTSPYDQAVPQPWSHSPHEPHVPPGIHMEERGGYAVEHPKAEVHDEYWMARHAQ